MKPLKNSLKPIAAFAFSSAILSLTSQAAILQVNVGPAGQPAETGFTDWTTGDRSTPAPTTISGIGLSMAGSVNDGAADEIRSINRTNTYVGPLTNLTQTWWGTRIGGGGGGAGGFLTIALDGVDLGAGSFEWTSWHHDQDNQTGVMDIEVSVDGGSTFALAVDDFGIVDNVADGNVGAPNPATFSFTANGTDDVQVRFTNVSGGGSASDFALLNGFQVVVPEPGSLIFVGLGSFALLGRRRRMTA